MTPRVKFSASARTVLATALACSALWAAIATLAPGRGETWRDGDFLLLASAALTEAPAAPTAGNPDVAQARSVSRAFQAVAKRLEPSVVNIASLGRVQSVDFFGNPRGPARVVPTGFGSGVIVSQDGYVLTNNHVVQGAEGLEVTLGSGRRLEAKVVGRDPATDVAVVKVDASDLPAAPFGDSDALEVGEWVVAIGSPLGLPSTVTAGVVSAKGRSGIGLPGQDGATAYQDFIQTDAAINPGNSGGPLLNLDGQIVGVNSAIASRSGGSEGIGFAIPSNMARAIMNSILTTGRVTRGWLGVGPGMEGREAASPEGVGGVLIQEVQPESPAQRAGVREGDVLLAIDGRSVNSWARLRTAIALTAPGTSVKLDVLRDGQRQTLTAELGDQSVALGIVELPRVGLTLQTLTRAMARQRGYRNLRGGVAILEVRAGGVAETSGLEANDIVVEVEGEAVASAQELQKSLDAADLARGVRLSVVRGDERGWVTLRATEATPR